MKTELSEVIKKIRDRAGLNNRELAKKIGYSESFINNVIYGNPAISADLLVSHFSKSMILSTEEYTELERSARKAEDQKIHIKVDVVIRFLLKHRDVLTEKNLNDLKKVFK